MTCPCSFDPHEKYTFGDLNSTSFRDIRFGEAYQRIRRKFRANWEATPLCTRCSYAWEGGDCARETVHEAVFLGDERY